MLPAREPSRAPPLGYQFHLYGNLPLPPAGVEILAATVVVGTTSTRQGNFTWNPTTRQLLWEPEPDSDPKPPAMLEGDSSSEGTLALRGNTDAALNDEYSAGFSASTTGPFAASNSDSEIDNIDQLFDGMEFIDGEVTRDGLVLYVEPIGADRRLAILTQYASFGLTINSFDPSALTPFGPTAKVVFLWWPKTLTETSMKAPIISRPSTTPVEHTATSAV